MLGKEKETYGSYSILSGGEPKKDLRLKQDFYTTVLNLSID